MKEHYYDKLLNIKTRGEQIGFPTSLHYYRYEPTPYSALEKLFEKYDVKPGDRVVDFGCGKGRLNFYIHYFFKASVVGVEMNEEFCRAAEENYKGYIKKHRTNKGEIQFYCSLAEEYPIHPADNRFYFFNPFSIQIFMTIINNILLSYEKASRELELILYYPSEDYIYFLESNTPFSLKNEVDLKELYGDKPNERFLIYRLGY
ncbi:SAM-dependent methyltransferase [Ammoniphilus resinae]|uniref:SAM-dependent methyltransferase n=1 Tax=Ammoniphilus resinae TaxID=861532 RepID=A0ABS4GSV8_9BACL|nr:methyltransferase [Ammoniphilus resinae]MBP1933112.1 SAM-dependent methyltransferase [Ammoniphilus resinae]